MQRLRIRFSRGESIKFISHLDIMRLWERALRRARIPIAYSEGFSPHPRISLAVPLAVGITSEAELMDVCTSRAVSPHYFTSAAQRQLPAGIGILGIFPMALTVPSLQSQVRFAEYAVKLDNEGGPADVKSAITGLLSKESLPWHHDRDTGTRNYDLRALINDLWIVEATGDNCVIGMRLRCDGNGSGRPEQVAVALGFSRYPVSIHRTGLVLET